MSTTSLPLPFCPFSLSLSPSPSPTKYSQFGVFAPPIASRRYVGSAKVECGHGRVAVGKVREMLHRFELNYRPQIRQVAEPKKERCLDSDFAQPGTGAFLHPVQSPQKSGYVVARNFFLLLLNSSAWPCLAVA